MIGTVTTALGTFNERPAFVWSDDYAPIPVGPGIFQAYLYNDLIYCVGAALLESPAVPGVQIYNPATDSWSRGADIIDFYPGEDGWETHGAGVGAFIYAINPSRIYRYDISANTWTNLGLNPVGHLSFGCYAAVGTDIFMFHGANVEKLNTLTNTLTTLGSWATGREGASAVYSPNHGGIFIAGGHFDLGPSHPNGDRSVEIYSPSGGTFTQLPYLPIGHQDTTAAMLDDKLWVMGGGPAATAVSVYDSDVGTWSSGPPLSGNRDDSEAVTYAGRIYLFGGEDGGEYNGTGRMLATAVLNQAPDTTSSTAEALLDYPLALAVDPTNTNVLYFSEITRGASRIRKWDRSAGEVTTLVEIHADNATTTQIEQLPSGFVDLTVSANGTLFALVATAVSTATTSTTYEIRQIHLDNPAAYTLIAHRAGTTGPEYGFQSIAADSNDDIYIAAYGYSEADDDYFNGVLRVCEDGQGTFTEKLTLNQRYLEAGTFTGWIGVGSHTGISASSTMALNDDFIGAAYALRLAGATGSAGTVEAHAAGNDVLVIPGETYRLTAQFHRNGATARTVQVIAAWYDSGGITPGSFIGESVAGSLTEGGSWTKSFGDVVAPPSAAYVQMRLRILNVALGEAHYVDRISLMGPGTLEVYAGGWGVDTGGDSGGYNETDGPRLEAVISTSGHGFPTMKRLVIDGDDNLWLAGYQCIRKISADGQVTTPIGQLKDLADTDLPLDPDWIIGAGGPGGIYNRTSLGGYGSGFVYALATTWDTADQHVFMYSDWAVIHHAAINADVCGPYLSGEQVIRDSEYGRYAASYQSHGMAYADGYLYFTERFGPTIRRIEVGGASVAPRSTGAAGTAATRVRRV